MHTFVYEQKKERFLRIDLVLLQKNNICLKYKLTLHDYFGLLLVGRWEGMTDAVRWSSATRSNM
jgi:hypothetical protein